jgi:hypothetical protein
MRKTYELTFDPTLSTEEVIKRLISALSAPSDAPPSVKTAKKQSPSAPAALSLDQVRERLANARLANKDLDLAGLFQRFNAKKLSEVDPKDYEALLVQAGAE